MSDRRNFLKVGATAVLGLGAVGVGAGCLNALDAPPTGEGVLNEERIGALEADPELRSTWRGEVKDLADAMMNDAGMREKFITRTNSVQLVRLYNDHLDILEPLLGQVDGSQLEGRLFKMIASSELFDGVEGFDLAYTYGGEDYEDQACSRFMAGCCTTHFWDNRYAMAK
ncbi:MAG: hypothetical protein V2A73_12710 [Pseudomonadota bacterium]